MSKEPNYSNNVSLKLSQVFDDIGVNKRMVLKRRRTFLLLGNMRTTVLRLIGKPFSSPQFGSQCEGSTTVGLNSDIDILLCSNVYNVIQDWGEWQNGRFNLLTIQDETTSPSYCLLQLLRDDEPLPFPVYRPRQAGKFVTDRNGRVLMKNSIDPNHFFRVDDLIRSIGPTVRHGPAQSFQGRSNCNDVDIVLAFYCKSWPVEAQPWLARRGIGGWPTEEIKRYCETTGFFVVPVGSKGGQNEELEWRISTSLAERCLMFSLNITQIRCYILMKMILKTFINLECENVLSTFMCKTVLFHCIQNTHSNKWQKHNLLACLKLCLIALQNCVIQIHCPHFIIPGNNLMAGRISPLNKRKLLEILERIIQSEGRALLEISIDQIGMRLQVKMNILPVILDCELQLFSPTISAMISESLLSVTADTLCDSLECLSLLYRNNQSVHLGIKNLISILVKTYSTAECNKVTKAVCKLLIPPHCSTLGSVIAASDIQTENTLSQEALSWLLLGVNSDVLSGRLKLASALYCSGNMERAELVLRNAEELYDPNKITPCCVCHCLKKKLILKREFTNICNTGNEEVIRHVTALCVTFMQCEINCVPKELRYEMFRSTQDDNFHSEIHNETPGIHYPQSDMAAVDPLPYLYFLQYKTYGHLQRPAGQHCALEYLATTIDTEINLGHRETALNLLGQCMELENRYNDALSCYTRSLKIRPRHNAAKIHICRLLNMLVNRQAGQKHEKHHST